MAADTLDDHSPAGEKAERIQANGRAIIGTLVATRAGMSATSATNSHSPAAILLVLCFGVAVYYFAKQVNPEHVRHETAVRVQEIHDQVAADQEAQYDIAKRAGRSMDAHFRASVVAAAYLQAHDEGNYQKWKAIEDEEAVNAGLRRR